VCGEADEGRLTVWNWEVGMRKAETEERFQKTESGRNAESLDCGSLIGRNRGHRDLNSEFGMGNAE
jgi:hypothetical protein